MKVLDLDRNVVKAGPGEAGAPTSRCRGRNQHGTFRLVLTKYGLISLKELCGFEFERVCFRSASTSVLDLNQLNLLMRLLGTDLIKDNPPYFVDMRVILTVFVATDCREIAHQRVINLHAMNEHSLCLYLYLYPLYMI